MRCTCGYNTHTHTQTHTHIYLRSWESNVGAQNKFHARQFSITTLPNTGRLIKRSAFKSASYRHLSGALSISNQIKSFIQPPQKCGIIQLLASKWRREYIGYYIVDIYMYDDCALADRKVKGTFAPFFLLYFQFKQHAEYTLTLKGKLFRCCIV